MAGPEPWHTNRYSRAVGCCLTGCLRLIFFQIWRLIAAALLAVVFARIDDYVERRYGDRAVGRAYRAYRRRGKDETAS